MFIAVPNRHSYTSSSRNDKIANGVLSTYTINKRQKARHLCPLPAAHRRQSRPLRRHCALLPSPKMPTQARLLACVATLCAAQAALRGVVQG